MRAARYVMNRQGYWCPVCLEEVDSEHECRPPETTKVVSPRTLRIHLGECPECLHPYSSHHNKRKHKCL